MTTEYSFRFCFTPALGGFSSMETDRTLGAAENLTQPIVRFYTWEKPTISFGMHQNPCKRLEIGRCLADGIELVARPTGGREILHGWDLCCSVIWPVMNRHSAAESSGLFARINGILGLGLTRLGFKAKTHSVARKASFDNGPCFSQIDRGEISVSGKKIIASAQRIFNRTVLQQSSISVRKPDYELMDYLKIGKDARKRDRIVNSVAFLDEGPVETLSLPEIVKVFKGAFESELGESALFELPERGKSNKNKKIISEP